MEIEDLARKLEPLLPDQVRHWLRVRDLGDPDLRQLVDKDIVGTAHRVLGDFRNEPLLSLPPEKTSKRPIHLGTVLYEKDKWEFGITHGELLRNLGILGMSGSGKTNLAFHLLLQLVAKRVPFLFLDWKRTARHLLPLVNHRVHVYTPGRSLSPFPFNPFIPPPGLEPSTYIHQVVDVMADAYTLGDGSRSLLRRALATCYVQGNRSPTPSDVLTEVERIPGKDRVLGWKTTARRALESLEFANLTGEDRTQQQEFAASLLDSNTIVELDALSQGAKKFLIPLLALWIYYVQLGAQGREKLKLVIFVEEAHHVLYRNEAKARESILNMLFRQCREIGIAMVVIDQHPHLISSAALGNTYTTLCLNQKDPTDINKAAALSLVDSPDRRWFSLLPVGQAIVKMQDRWRRPFLIQVPHVHVPKGAVTDELLGRFLNGSITRSGLRRAVNKAARASGLTPAGLTRPLVASELAFLEDVLNHPDDGIRTRYARLCFSGDKGNKIKSRLVSDGFLQEQEVRTDTGRRLLLRPTPAARRKLGLNQKVGRGSLAHEYWKRFYANKLRADGYTVELEAPRPEEIGRVDVLAKRGDETLAVEIETGKSDVVENVRRDLLMGANAVIVAATDETAMHTVEYSLSKEGLLLPPRVNIALRDVGYGSSHT